MLDQEVTMTVNEDVKEQQENALAFFGTMTDMAMQCKSI
jgi:hypothetical protein